MKRVKITLIKDFVLPGKTIEAGREIEISEDRLANFRECGLIEGKAKPKKKAAKIEKATFEDKKEN